jgi:polar amino acid transport system substrate-binding protein
MTSLRTRLWLAVAGMVAAGAIAACGSSSSNSTTSSSSATGSSSSNGKTYIIATSADFPPYTSRSASDPNQIVGFEPDMVQALMKHLGWKYKYVTSDFNGLIPSVQSGRVDMVISDVYDTSAREKVVDFVDYAQQAFAIMVAASKASEIRSAMDLCGKSVGILTGSAPEVSTAQMLSKQCKNAGKPSLSVRSFPAVAQELGPLSNGTLDATLEADVTEAYISKKTNGKYKLVFELPSTATKAGIVVDKGSPLKAQLTNAVKWFTSSPQYRSYAQKWAVPASNLITSP